MQGFQGVSSGLCVPACVPVCICPCVCALVCVHRTWGGTWGGGAQGLADKEPIMEHAVAVYVGVPLWGPVDGPGCLDWRAGAPHFHDTCMASQVPTPPSPGRLPSFLSAASCSGF